MTTTRAVAIASLVILGSGCFNGGGPGNFNLPTTSKPASTSFVRVYEPCTGPDSTTTSGLPSCRMFNNAYSAYHFGPKGYCTLKTGTKLTEPCQYAAPANGSCFDEFGSIECVDIRNSLDTPISSATGWSANFRFRTTGREKNGDSDMTAVDTLLPGLASSVRLVGDGALEFKQRPSAWMAELLASFTDAQQPSDLNVELAYTYYADDSGHVFDGLGIVISDPDGYPFAAIGGAGAGPATCDPTSFDPIDAPAKGKAKSTKSSMVRAYAECGPSSPPNTTTSFFPACAPPVPASPGYAFGRKGNCTLALQHKAVACDTLPGGSCYALAVKVKCKDIRDASSMLINDGGWKLRLVARATIDQGSGAETLVDLPLLVDLPTATNGSLGATVTSAKTSMGPLGPAMPLPACTSMQVLGAEILDPVGNAFATLGRATNVD